MRKREGRGGWIAGMWKSGCCCLKLQELVRMNASNFILMFSCKLKLWSNWFYSYSNSNFYFGVTFTQVWPSGTVYATEHNTTEPQRNVLFCSYSRLRLDLPAPTLNPGRVCLLRMVSPRATDKGRRPPVTWWIFPSWRGSDGTAGLDSVCTSTCKSTRCSIRTVSAASTAPVCWSAARNQHTTYW